VEGEEEDNNEGEIEADGDKGIEGDEGWEF
jgi:hypothetical protein